MSFFFIFTIIINKYIYISLSRDRRKRCLFFLEKNDIIIISYIIWQLGLCGISRG